MNEQEAYQLKKFINARLCELQDEQNIDEFNRVAKLEGIVECEIARLWYKKQTIFTRARWWLKYSLCRLITSQTRC